jgi:inorganic pyrophosphatase
MVHPWHEIPVGDDFPNVFPVVVEVPRKGVLKYGLNPELGILELDRVTHPPIPYPANYGFIPQTLDEDGDPLDAVVAMQQSIDPLTVVEVRPIGMINLVDRGENDDKIICVHTGDPNYEGYETIDDLPEHERAELEWFFHEYKGSEGDVEVHGFEDTDTARETLEMCRRLYQDKFGEVPSGKRTGA